MSNGAMPPRPVIRANFSYALSPERMEEPTTCIKNPTPVAPFYMFLKELEKSGDRK